MVENVTTGLHERSGVILTLFVVKNVKIESETILVF